METNMFTELTSESGRGEYRINGIGDISRTGKHNEGSEAAMLVIPRCWSS
jgi:hypothetical protein